MDTKSAIEGGQKISPRLNFVKTVRGTQFFESSYSFWKHFVIQQLINEF